MAMIDNKFLATPAFVVKSAQGQNITLNIASYGTGSPKTYTRYRDLVIDSSLVLLAGADVDDFAIQGITPSVDFQPYSESGAILTGDKMAKYQFMKFIEQNPVHVSRLNFRASNMAYIPTQVVVSTPNLFAGQVEKQVLNVTADANMYQNQSNIITVDCDLYICRNSIITFNASFSEASAPTLAVDIKIDAYLSLEKAFVENLRLLDTATGQEALLSAGAAALQATAEPLTVTNPDAAALFAGATVKPRPVARPTTAAEWYDQKAFNSRGNR